MPQFSLDKLLNVRICGKSPIGAFLRINEWTWHHLPLSVSRLRPVRSYGHFLHMLVRRWGNRRQYFGTFFLRNRPQLELILKLSYLAESASTLRILVLGCSNGAEAYSILATLRSARPELRVTLHAVDISREVLEIARKGSYSLNSPELVGERIFQRMTEVEINKIFNREADHVVVQSWVKEGTIWDVGDARDSQTLQLLGSHDIVIANNFLCHMTPLDAEKCLCGIVNCVKKGGFLVVSGIDLDVRTKIATHQGWKPVTELLDEIHDGDPSLRGDWPMNYWGLEPLDKGRPDRHIRYCSAFQIG
jgi:SAM-dependent methyltransferase